MLKNVGLHNNEIKISEEIAEYFKSYPNESEFSILESYGDYNDVPTGKWSSGMQYVYNFPITLFW